MNRKLKIRNQSIFWNGWDNIGKIKKSPSPDKRIKKKIDYLTDS
ncbi:MULTISPECIES: hypothetical protein [unclassified Bacillus (in: firmicutes)]|nr:MULTISPECIES: hypothetical protein [unclassified Bacillus (in: firmicutes)]